MRIKTSRCLQFLTTIFPLSLKKKKNEKRKTEKKNQNELILQTGLNITRKLINIIKIKLCKGMNMLKSTKHY